MKKLLFLLLISSQILFAQEHDPRSDQFNYVPNEVLVKFVDDAIISDDATTLKSTGIISIDNILKSADIVKLEKLFPQKKTLKAAKVVKDPHGRDMIIPSLHNIYKLTLPSLKAGSNEPTNIHEYIEQLQALPEVEYAEPNYNYSVNDFTIDSDIIQGDNINKRTSENSDYIAPNDPLYPQQTNITTTNIDKVWENYTTGDGSQTIAILDTGIDYEHPDLVDNIWINEAELNGVEGFDDDGNGYVDDIRGWDFINLDNAPLDDNMHGTHVAGIAGAVGGNGIGIAGAAWNVKLMPIKVFQSNGVGNASTIAEGIIYASENGATILNMSFGSFAESITMRLTLENAYATSVLVAAAGNDRIKIGPCIGCYPFYPAAYTYVIGVEDYPKPNAGYTNYDQDGPIFSGYSNLLNYELTAPGTGILSTVPNGGYRTLTGTSMASPLIAGGLALYLQQKPGDSKEILFGNLINTAGSYVDILAAIEVVPTPELKVITAITKDTINGQNGNGYLEPGETIEIFPLIKNYWGSSDDVRVGIEFAEFEDNTKAEIIDSVINIGSITAYATLQDLTKSIKIKIAENVANNVNIKFNLKVWSGPNMDYLTSTEYVINVKNSILLYGIISENMTLTSDKEYLVSNNLILTGITILTIEPGVTLRVSDNKSISILENSKIIAIGNKDLKINIVNENISWGGLIIESTNNSIFKFVKFKGINSLNNSSYYLVNVNSDIEFENVLFTNFNTQYLFSDWNGKYIHMNKVSFYENVFIGWGSYNRIINNDWYNINIVDNIGSRQNEVIWFDASNSVNSNNYFNIFNNIKSGNKSIGLLGGNGSSGVANNVHFYLGTSSNVKLDEEIHDALNTDNTGIVIMRDSLSSIPYKENHGIVWKVLVNGKDAQDEYEQMDPVGVGAHQFDVYFNRAMDTSFTPQISYGVREPYTQKNISEEGTWSEDGKIYSVTHEVKIGAADGINRIRVQHARDLDYFEIPIEDSRFNMLVQSAGSASAGFMATPGLGKITLDWETPAAALLEDLLGFNIYRYEAITDTTFTNPVKTNSSLVADPQYIDYNVEEGKRYYYQYKILRTSFEETDFSTTVAAEPLTSILGDCNGDFDVNVMDLVSSVDYILGNNPTPFIFKAADVNSDTYINVLDIVGTVDIILHPSTKRIATSTQEIEFYSNTPVGDALFYWEDNDLYVESKEAIAGFQLAFANDFSYSLSPALNGFEWLNYTQDHQKVVMMYSFSGIAIAPGKTKLLSKTTALEAGLDITKAAVGTPKGLKLNPIFKNGGELLDIDAPIQSDQAELITVAPNPSRGIFNIQYYIPEQMDKVLIQVYSLKGEQLWSDDVFKNTSGQASATLDLRHLNDGIYLVVMDVLRNGEIKKREVKKLIISKN